MTDPAIGALLMQFAAAYGCMLVIPGPNTFVVLRACDGTSATRPLTAAAGVACGATLASVVAASSAAALPTGAGFRAVSAVVVAALLLRTALNASRPRPATAPPRGKAADVSVAPFLLGLAVSGLNPVSVPYFASFFISHGCGHLATALTCALVFAMAGCWFSAVGLASTRLGRVPVSRPCRRTFDLVTAAILAGLAFRHLWMAFA